MSQIIKQKIGTLFFDYINGFAFKSDDFSITKSDEVLPVLKIANIGNGDFTNFKNCHYHNFNEYKSFIAHKGDLAFSLTGSLGYVSVITEDCLVNQRVFVIKNNPKYRELLNVIQPFIKSSEFASYCYSKATSESNKNISPNVILNYEIDICYREDGTIDIDKQRELCRKYQDVENKKVILLNRINYLKSAKVILEGDNSIKYVDIPLNEIITHNNGKAIYTKEFCRIHRGSYPVYSANNKTPLAYMNFSDYNGTYLTYSKNGCAGYINILSGNFSINGDRCVISINKGYEDIDLLYLKYFLEPIFRANIKGRIGINGKNEYTKINSNMIKKLNIMVPIPIKNDKSFDLQKQKDLAQEYATIDSIKNDLYKQITNLTSIIVI